MIYNSKAYLKSPSAVSDCGAGFALEVIKCLRHVHTAGEYTIDTRSVSKKRLLSVADSINQMTRLHVSEIRPAGNMHGGRR